MLYTVPRPMPKAYRLLIRVPKFRATMLIPATARLITSAHATPGDISPERNGSEAE